MVDLGVIVRVDEPTDWVSNYVAVEKPDGSLHVCLDPQELNKAIKNRVTVGYLKIKVVRKIDSKGITQCWKCQGFCQSRN